MVNREGSGQKKVVRNQREVKKREGPSGVSVTKVVKMVFQARNREERVTKKGMFQKKSFSQEQECVSSRKKGRCFFQEKKVAFVREKDSFLIQNGCFFERLVFC